MVSLPDYDPNNPREALDPSRINRLTTGVFEMGSTFKALTLAMALDSGKITLNSAFDARHPLQLRQVHHPRLPRPEPRADRARDLHLFVEHRHRADGARPRRRAPQGVPARRWASSTGCAPNCRKAPSRSCPSAGASSTPSPSPSATACRWRRCRRSMAVGALMNGGSLIPPTFLKRSEQEAMALAKQVIKPETSEKMRYLMRLNAEKGTATKADVPGYYVGGKTGTVREGGRRPLLQDQAAHHLHGGAAGRQAALSAPDHARRAAGDCRKPTASPPRAGTRCRSAAP